MAVRKRGKSWQIDFHAPDGKRVRISFKTKKEAEDEWAKRRVMKAEKRWIEVKREYTTIFGELLDKYRENFQHQASFANSKVHFFRNFRTFFGEETRLANIRYADLERYRNHLRNKPTIGGGRRADASINREMVCLHHVFRKAEEWEMVERSPFARGKSFIAKENNKRVRFLSEAEVTGLLAECPRHLRRIVECALNTGMRKGEILGLKWEQVRNGFIYLHKTKTNEPRQIPINDALDKLFADLRKEQGPGATHVFTFTKGEHKLAGELPVRERKKLAPLPEGVKNVRTAFSAACRRAGIANFRFHDLRHTFASHLVMRGVSIKAVQELLGHKNIQMTMRYAHLSQEHKKEAVNVLNGLTATTKPAKTSCHKVSHFEVVTRSASC